MSARKRDRKRGTMIIECGKSEDKKDEQLPRKEDGKKAEDIVR